MERVDSSLIALRQIMLATETFSKKLAQSVGLTAPQLRVLQLVSKSNQCTATQIAKQTRITQATVTSLIDKLVKKGLVIRERSIEDKRQTNILVTDLGRQAIESAPDPLQQKFVSKFSSLEDWEQAALISALERVASMLDAEDIKAAPVLDTGKLDEN